MAILKIKLVESLSKDRYLRENIIDIDNIIAKNPKLINEEELADIKSTTDIKLIQTFVQKLIDADIIKDEYKSVIVGSIIDYRSLDPNINPIINIYNIFDGKISADKLNVFANVFEETSCSNQIIKKYFNQNTDILANDGEDLEYLIKLVIFLSDKYKAKKYSNGKRSPSIEEDLLDLDSGKFKQVKEIKKLMDKFLTNSDNDTISLKKWFEEQHIEEYKKFIVDNLNNADVTQYLEKNDKESIQLFADKLDTLFMDKKAIGSMLNNIDIPQALSKDNPSDITQLLDLIFNYLTDDDAQVKAGSVDDVLTKAGYKTLSKKFEGLKDAIAKMEKVDTSEKLAAQFKLELLKDKNNENLTNALFQAQVPDANIDKLPKVIFEFLKKAVQQNYLYTTIREAMALNGKQPAQGDKFLQHYIVNMSNKDAVNNYLNRFNKVWNNKQLQKQLLNARITRTNNKFNWTKAITNFLDDVKL